MPRDRRGIGIGEAVQWNFIKLPMQRCIQGSLNEMNFPIEWDVCNYGINISKWGWVSIGTNTYFDAWYNYQWNAGLLADVGVYFNIWGFW